MSEKEKHGTVPPATTGQIKDIISALVQAMPTNLTADEAKKIIGQKGKLGAELRKIFREIASANYCTLEERLLLELRHVVKTGGQLGINNVVIPAGAGNVPRAYWRGGKLSVMMQPRRCH
ncbi:MAG: hypothetical protein PHC97_03245 [Patescibacteria group bacterium]|nr:hypothetical protein [Patescibacteria group bacterium]